MTISPVRVALSTSADELGEVDRRHLVHPHQSGARTERIVMVRGKGSTVWDAHGAEFLDATGGGNWLAQVGHGRRELADAAAAQAGELAYFTSFDIFSNDKSIRLAARLAGMAPAGLNRVYFTCGGSEGVDTAIKIARLFHHNRGDTDRTWILARHMGYHGASYGSGTATGWPAMQAGVGPNLPHVAKVSPPNLYRAAELYGDEDPTDFLLRELAETIDQIGPGKIAAMIGEPVMGGGGVLAPPAGYWPRVRALLSKHGILLIADEVVTAFGRTGEWFASAALGMAPDIVVTAKGLTSGYQPLGAVLMRDEIGETVAGQDAYFFHGHTYFGHSTGCAVALVNLDLIDNEGLVGRALKIGDWFRAALAPAAQLPHVGDIRIEGATVGVELVVDRDTREPMMAGNVATETRNAHGVIVRDYGPTLVISPPLVLEEHEAHRAANALTEVLSRLGSSGELTSR